MDPKPTREQQVETALFRGGNLNLQNPVYSQEAKALLDALTRVDLTPEDLTVAALEIESKPATATVLAREPGVAAGLEEFALLFESQGIRVTFGKRTANPSMQEMQFCGSKATGTSCFRASVLGSMYCNA